MNPSKPRPAPYLRREKQHIEKRRRLYYAVMTVPADVRAAFEGKRKITRTLETDSLVEAEKRAAPILLAWRQLIAKARGETRQRPHHYRSRLTAQELAAVREVLDLGGASYVQEDDGTLRPVRDGAIVVRNVERRTGNLADRIAEWHATSRVTAKTKDMQAADVRRFAERFPTVADVSKGTVKRWIDGLMSDPDPEKRRAPKTVQRILSALRGYWKFLQSSGIAPDDVEPFVQLFVATNGGRVKREDRRQAFKPAEVVTLLGEARKRDDAELADLIDMARWSGARIEELCSLKVESVNLTASIPSFTINAGKTDAAIREVPIHKELLPVLRRLIGERTSGYVLADLTENKYGDRSNAIGKRFGNLKAALGFGDQFVFHSIRKTVATMLKDAGIPEATAADILGHDIVTMSYGVYAEHVSLATKARAVAKLSYSSKERAR